MKIFIAHAHEDLAIADRIQTGLRQEKHEVFFASTDIAASSEFNRRIRSELESSDVMIFLVSAASLEKGKYTWSEIEIAQQKWPDPSNRVLPVVVDDIGDNEIPAYLATVSALTPRGDTVADVAHACRFWEHP